MPASLIGQDELSVGLDWDRVRGWMFDVDGCLVNTSRAGGEGGTIFPGANELLHGLKSAGHRVVVCTNASGRSPAFYAEVLRQAGVEIDVSELLTAGESGAFAVATRHPGARVLALGGEGIVSPLQEAGARLVDPGGPLAEVVLVGAKTHYSPAEVDAACKAIVAGAPLYAAVLLRWFHGGQGRQASLTSVVVKGIEWITGTRAQITGKPSSIVAGLIAQRLGVDPSAIVIVGDSLEAEVGMAAQMGAQSVWVKSGAPGTDATDEVTARPDLSVADVGELLRMVAGRL